MYLKGRIIKVIISIVISQDKEAYKIKEAAGYNKGKRGKNPNYYFSFFKIALCCRFEPLVYFIFGQYPEHRSFHFN